MGEEYKRVVVHCRVTKWEPSPWAGKVRKGFLHERYLDGSLGLGKASFRVRRVALGY